MGVVQRRSSAGVLRRRGTATDPEQARSLVAGSFLPNRIEPLGDGAFGARVESVEIGDVTLGRIGFDGPVRLTTSELRGFHLVVPMAGEALLRRAGAGPVPLSTAGAVVLDPGSPVDVEWGPRGEQIWVTVTRERIQTQLGLLLGHPVLEPLGFDVGLALDSPGGRRLATVLQLVDDELTEPSLLGLHPVATRHLATVVLDCLLLGQRHSASDELARSTTRGPARAVAHAIDLLEDDPGRPWSVIALAAEVHLSVRSLQESFRRDAGVPPMTYLRHVRLRRAHDALVSARPDQTTVRAVATEAGLMHLGRFAQVYRDRYGESPSQTLARPPS